MVPPIDELTCPAALPAKTTHKRAAADINLCNIRSPPNPVDRHSSGANFEIVRCEIGLKLTEYRRFPAVANVRDCREMQMRKEGRIKFDSSELFVGRCVR